MPLHQAVYTPQQTQTSVPSIVPSIRVVKRPQSQVLYLPKWATGLLVAALAFVCLQGVRCALGSIIKVEKLIVQLNAVVVDHKLAKQAHSALNDKISLYSSPSGVEELAREGLELVRPDEVLVRLYRPNTPSH